VYSAGPDVKGHPGRTVDESGRISDETAGNEAGDQGTKGCQGKQHHGKAEQQTTSRFTTRTLIDPLLPSRGAASGAMVMTHLGAKRYAVVRE